MDPVQIQVACMMRWHSRAVTIVSWQLLLLTLYLVVPGAIYQMNAVPIRDVVWSERILFCGLLAIWVILLLCGLMIVWQVFLSGWMAFGTRSGLGYAVLTTLLLWGPGMFLIPHMVRLDIQRLLGAEPSNIDALPGTFSSDAE